jgi:hypothetical protein
MIAMDRNRISTALAIMAILMSLLIISFTAKAVEAGVISMQIDSPKETTYNVHDVPLDATVILEDAKLASNSLFDSMFYSIDDSPNATLSYYMNIDSQGHAVYRGIMTVFNLSEGAHRVVIYYNNTNGPFMTGSVIFTVDSTVPKIAIISPQNITYNTDVGVHLVFIVNKSTSWMGYSIDNHANVTLTGNLTGTQNLARLNDGLHNITVYANDTAGNTGKSETVIFITKAFHQSQNPYLTPSPSTTATIPELQSGIALLLAATFASLTILTLRRIKTKRR